MKYNQHFHYVQKADKILFIHVTGVKYSKYMIIYREHIKYDGYNMQFNNILYFTRLQPIISVWVNDSNDTQVIDSFNQIFISLETFHVVHDEIVRCLLYNIMRTLNLIINASHVYGHKIQLVAHCRTKVNKQMHTYIK